MMATALPPAGLLVAAPLMAPVGPPTWEELFAAVDQVFATPMVPYAILSAAIFNSADPPLTLLNKLE